VQCGVLSLFTKVKDVAELHACERRRGVVWINMRPLYRLTATHLPELQTFGVFALACLSYSETYRQRLLDAQLGDYLQLLQYLPNVNIKPYWKILSSKFGKFGAVPSLLHICKFYLIHNYMRLGMPNKKTLFEKLSKFNLVDHDDLFMT
jgi:hypothetical protein